MNNIESNFAVFTVCNLAYLPKVLVLAESLNDFHPTNLNVVIFDRKAVIPIEPRNLNIIWVEDLGLANWKELAFMYDIIEFSTSLKPLISMKLLKNYEKVIFLDPDTKIFSNLNCILAELESWPVVLTPHYLTPQPDTEHESDLAMMRFGSFNMGFFAVRHGEDSMKFLRWWHQRCVDFSFMESQFGLSTDQKWVSIAPCFFDFLKISFNEGLNAAPWNTFERTITRNSTGEYYVNGKQPLVFFHFSNFDHSDPQYLKKRASNESGKSYAVLEEIGSSYSAALRLKEKEVGNQQYAFDYMSDGSYISPTLRRAYASLRKEFPLGHDPFESRGCVGAFARKNGLLSGSVRKYRSVGLRDSLVVSRYMRFVTIIMRLALRVLGPNRFYDLSKLMVYLSLYRRQPSYWKR